MQRVKDFLFHGFESGYPTAKDKHGKLHCLLEEGYSPRIIGRGDNYEDIVAKEGPPPRYRDTLDWSGLSTFHEFQKQYRAALYRLWAAEKAYPGLMIAVRQLCDDLEPMFQGVESYIAAKQEESFTYKERCRLNRACDAIQFILEYVELWLRE